MTLVSTAVVQMYGCFTIQALDVIEGGQWCRVQALVQGNPWSLPSLFFYLDPSASMQGGSQSPDDRSGSLFFEWMGSVSLGLGIQYSPISGGATAYGAGGPASLPSPLMWKAKLTVARWRVMMSCKPTRY